MRSFWRILKSTLLYTEVFLLFSLSFIDTNAVDKIIEINQCHRMLPQE